MACGILTVTVDKLRAKAQQRTSAELLRLIYEKEAKADGASHIRGSGRILFLRYEDLLTDTETWLESILEFLGLSYDMHMLDFHKHPRTTKNADRIEAWANLRRPVIKRNAGKYRTTLSLPDLRYIELRCYDLMGPSGTCRNKSRSAPTRTRQRRNSRLSGVRLIRIAMQL